MTITDTMPADETWRSRRIDRKQQEAQRKHDLKLQRRAIKKQLADLMHKKYNRVKYHLIIQPASWLFKLLLFVLCLYAGKLAVTGVYDLLWEGNARLNYAAYLLFGVAVALSAIMGIRSRFVMWTAAARTAYFASLLLVLLGGAAMLAYVELRGEGVTTNTALWHWLVPSNGLRHLMFRAWPEGLLGGLLWGFVSWNPLKYHRIAWFNPVLRRVLPTLDETTDDERPIRAWMVWISPLVVVAAAAIVGFSGYWVVTVIQHHVVGLHTWIHNTVPWHVNANLTPTGTSTVDTAKNSVFADAGTWFIGFASARWWGRPAVYGIINRAHELLVQLRIIKKRELVKVISAFQPHGYQVRAVMEWNEGASEGNAVKFAEDEVYELGPNVVAPLRVGPYLTALFAIYGGVFLYYLANR